MIVDGGEMARGMRARRSVKRRGGSVFDRVAQMQITGSTVSPWTSDDAQWKRSGSRAKLQTVADLPADFVETLNNEETREYERQTTFNGRRRAFTHVVREIYDILDSVGQDKKQLRRIMHEIVQRVLDTSGMHPSMMMGGASSDVMADVVTKERERFLRVGGAECLLRVIHVLRQDDQASNPAPATAGQNSSSRATVIIDGERRVRQQRHHMSYRNDVRSLWEHPVPLHEGRSKNRQDGAARKAILNDAMVRRSRDRKLLLSLRCRMYRTYADMGARIGDVIHCVGSFARAVLLFGGTRAATL